MVNLLSGKKNPFAKIIPDKEPQRFYLTGNRIRGYPIKNPKWKISESGDGKFRVSGVFPKDHHIVTYYLQAGSEEFSIDLTGNFSITNEGLAILLFQPVLKTG